MSNTLVELKLECLKLAYDTFHKTGGFSTARVYNMEDSPENLMEDVKEVFALSDMNFKYILGDKSISCYRCGKEIEKEMFSSASICFCGNCNVYLENEEQKYKAKLEKKSLEATDE